MSGLIDDPARANLTTLVDGTPGVGEVLRAIVERHQGRLPRRVTTEAPAEAIDALRRIFSARAVTRVANGRVRVELGAFLRASGKSEREVLDLLSSAIRSRPAPARGEDRALRAELQHALADISGTARTPAARTFLAAEAGGLGAPSSELAEHATREGAARALARVRDVTRCMDALEEVSEPIRVQNFSARVLGSSKALRPSSDLFRRLGAALVDHHAPTRLALDDQGVPPHRKTEIARALEVHGIYQDEVAASVLCFGPIVYRKRGATFDHVARHSALGESSRLITHQLRDAIFEPPAARRVTLFENLTPYLDYVDACVDRRIEDEIVLCSAGQASWAVIAVLRGMARAGLPVRHSGDLDRAGVLILRSLRRRSGAQISPLLMDAATHARFGDRGIPITPEERRRLERLLSEDPAEALCGGLLRAILESGVWIEQEQFTDELLAAALGFG